MVNGDACGQFSFELNEFVSGNWHKMKLSRSIHTSLVASFVASSPISQFAFAFARKCIDEKCSSNN